MITILHILRIIGVIFVAFYTYFYVIKNNENIFLLFFGIVTIILSSFFISMTTYKQNIQPFFINNNFSKIDNLNEIKKEIIKSDNIKIDYAFYKDNLIILRLHLDDNAKDNKKNKNIFSGIYVIKKDVVAKPFYIINTLEFKQKLNIKTNQILLDNTIFNDYFKLYTDDKINTFKFLNPIKLDFISSQIKNINCKMSLFYKNNSMYIYLHNFNFSKNIEQEYNTLLNIIKEFE